MTITALPSRDEYTSSAGQTVFNYSFKIYESSNLDVYVTPAGQVANDAADLTTAYVVDPNTIGNPTGGLITFNSPLSNGDLVTIVSSVPYDRTVDYQVNGDFLPTTVNGDNDRQVSQIKQVLTRANRTLTYPQSLQSATSLTLPTPEAGLFLKWKTDLTGLENTDVDASFLPITGGTMAGDINMGGYNIVNIGNGFLPLSGGTMTGSINMGDNDISNIDLIVADRAVIGGSAIIPGGDFTITIAEQVTLTDGQVVVVFLADTAGATFYVNGLSVDSGLIIEDLDYQIDNVTKTMTLVNSYPAGTILTMRYFDGDSGIAPTAYDSVAAMKSTVLPIGKLVTTKGYYAPGDGGGADYLVAASQAVDGYGDHTLANGNVSLLQSSPLTVECFGARGDGVADDTASWQAAFDYITALSPQDGGTIHTTIGKKYSLEGVDYSGQRIHLVLNKGSTILSRGVTPAIFNDSAPSTLDVTGLGLLSKAAGQTGICIHHKWGSIRLDGVRGSGFDGVGVFLDGTDVSKSINNSYIGGIKFQDCGGIVLQGAVPGVSVECTLGEMHFSSMRSTGLSLKSVADVVGGDVISDVEASVNQPAVLLEDIAGCQLGRFWTTSLLNYGVSVTSIGAGVNQQPLTSTIDFIGGINSSTAVFIDAKECLIGKVLAKRSSLGSVVFGANCDNLAVSQLQAVDGSEVVASADVTAQGNGNIAIAQFTSVSAAASSVVDFPVGNKIAIGQVLGAFSGGGNAIETAPPYKNLVSLSSNLLGRQIGSADIVGNNSLTEFTITHGLKVTPNFITVTMRGSAGIPIIRTYAAGVSNFKIVFATAVPVGTFAVDYAVEY